MLLHLIEDDEEWSKAFEEVAATFVSGYSLCDRCLYLHWCLTHWYYSRIFGTRFCNSVCDDLEHTIVQNGYAVLLELIVGVEF